jgi:hypothetical protein
MKEALISSEKSVLTGATRRNIPEDAILHSHSSENLKYYIVGNAVWRVIAFVTRPLITRKKTETRKKRWQK